MSRFRIIVVVCAFLVSALPLLASPAQAQDLAIVDIGCESTGRIVFSVTNLGFQPSGVFRLRIDDENGRQVSNFGPQSSLGRGATINGFLELISAPRQRFTVIVDPNNQILDRNRSNNFADVICSSSGVGGPSGPSGPGAGTDCRQIEVFGFPVTICEPGVAQPVRPPRNVRHDLSIENAACGRRRLRYSVGNFGLGGSTATQVALINADTNAIVRTWDLQPLALGQIVDIVDIRPTDGTYVLTILQRGDANPQNDTVTLICGRGGGFPRPIPSGDLALENPRCSPRRLLVDTRNVGGRRTQEATAILIDESDTVVTTFRIEPLRPGEVASDGFGRHILGETYRVAIIDADEENLGNNFIFFVC